MNPAPQASPLLFEGVADAYLEWAFKTEFRYLGGRDEDRIGLLLRWKTCGSEEADANMAKAQKEQPGLDMVDVYAGRSVCALAVPAEDLKDFLSKLADVVEGVELSTPIVVCPREEAERAFSQTSTPESTGGTAAPASSQLLPEPPSILLGLLDDSCAFANRRFLHNSVPRVHWLWDQNEKSGGEMPTRQNGPGAKAKFRKTDFRYGGQWSRVQLAHALDKAGGDEDAAYRLAGVSGLQRRATHGAHVMDLMAGAGEHPMVVVQFPAIGIDDPSGRWLARHALDGLHYVLAHAGPNTQKVVVNISWGPQTGPHDGTSLLEEAIDELVAGSGGRLEVVFPAGNTYSSRAHGVVALVTGGAVQWVVPPDGGMPAFLEVWWPVDVDPAQARLTVEAPDGTVLCAASGFVEAPAARWSITLIRARKNGAMALVAVAPTAGGEGCESAAAAGPHGIWKVSVDRIEECTGEAHLYIARADHDMGARRRARASYLRDKAWEDARFRQPALRDEEAPRSVVRRAGTLNGIATGSASRVAAGYVGDWTDSTQDRRLSSYSSSGPSRDGKKAGPDYAFMTDHSLVVKGVRASGVRTGTVARLVGTSMAAPQYARELAVAPKRSAAKGGEEKGAPPPPPSDPRFGKEYRKPLRRH